MEGKLLFIISHTGNLLSDFNPQTKGMIATVTFSYHKHITDLAFPKNVQYLVCNSPKLPSHLLGML